MKKQRPLVYYILVFVLAQIAWFSLLGLWIYWYVTNHILITKVGQEISAQLTSDTYNVVTLVSGLILLVVVSIGMSMIFIYLARQLQLNRLYDNFIANVTHELKSPLSSIQLYLETMNTRKVPVTKQREFFSLMLKDVTRLNNLINSILYMSGFEKKKTALKYPHDYHIYDADSVIRELISAALIQSKIPEDAVKYKGTIPCKCVIDRNWLRIVFDNLFDNAKKYSTGRIKIFIRLRCNTKNIFIDIKDHGIGIPFKDHKKVFQKFHRIDHPESPNIKGTGLGLFWVKEIIGYHGGKIYVTSRGRGHGSTFRIELPVYQATKKRYIKNLLKRSNKNSGEKDA